MLFKGHRGQGYGTRAVRMLADFALSDAGQGGSGTRGSRPRSSPATRTRCGWLPGAGCGARGAPGQAGRGRPRGDRVVRRARTAAERPTVSEPQSFRALLNSFLPRKRAIGQLLVRDDGRPGAALPADLQARLGPARRGRRGRRVPAPGRRPRDRGGARPWTIEPGGRCSPTGCPRGAAGTTPSAWSSTAAAHHPPVLDGMVTQPREIRTAEFCTLDQVDDRCADFTARRIRAALAAVESGVPGYTESGRRSPVRWSSPASASEPVSRPGDRTAQVSTCSAAAGLTARPTIGSAQRYARPGCRTARRTGRRRAISSSWVPTSTTRAPSSTTIRSAIRTVENRCETRTVIRPSADSLRAARGVPLEQRVLGLGVQRGGRLVQHQQQRLARA